MVPSQRGSADGPDELGPTPVRGTRGHLLLESPGSGGIRQVRKWWQRWNDQPVWVDRLWVIAVVLGAWYFGYLSGRGHDEIPVINTMAEARTAIESLSQFNSVCMTILRQMQDE